MRIYLFILLFIFMALKAQNGFEISPGREKVKIPFQEINNLVFINLEINGVNLTFLLDTGVSETLLFSLENKEVSFENVEKVKFTGLGGSAYIEGIKSTKNKVFAGKDFKDYEHDIYIILDENFNFSSHVGIPINGIIGYQFFKNYPVKFDFNKHLITIYKDRSLAQRKFSNYEKSPMSIELQKPYVITQIQQTKDFFPAKMLLDLGNSDALWLFPNRIPNFNYNKPNIDDFLGRGFNGDIYGKRSRIHALKLGNNTLNFPIASMPNEESIKSFNFTKDRVGSIGSDVLKRFLFAFDYKNETFYFKKTPAIKLPFKFNMSGLDIKHDGMKWEQDLVKVDVPKNNSNNEKGVLINLDANEFRYKFILKPEYSIAGIREGSPAALSGLKKNDKIIEINSKKTSDMTLKQINEHFVSDEGKILKLKIVRNTEILNFELQLQDPIPYQEN